MISVKTKNSVPAPRQFIEKSIASAGLLAHIFTAKFVDAMPYYRQEKQSGKGIIRDIRKGGKAHTTPSLSSAIIGDICGQLTELRIKDRRVF